jgi:uncharacterized repeat protein (TIGR01451 family)
MTDESAKNEEKMIEEGLEAIYGNDQVDFSKLDRGRPRLTSILLTIVITLAVIAITAWTAFFVYSRYFASDNEKTFELTIETEEELVSGEETTIYINYSNPSAVPLASLELDVKLPNAFKPSSMIPAPDDAQKLFWDIGSVAPGSDGSIAITGIWIAAVPSSTPVQVFASYRPANFNSNFSEIETNYVNTVDSVITIKIDGPEEARPGENLDFSILVKNTGEIAMKDVTIKLSIPDGFFLEESSPSIEAGTTPSWHFDQIEALAEEEISFTGNFAADREGFQYFTGSVNITAGETELKQQSSDAFVDVLRHNLSLQLIANGTPDDVAVELNDTLRLTVALENTGETIIDDADLLIDFQSELSLPIVWGNAQLDGGSITGDGVYWSSGSVGSIDPGEKRQFNLSFPIDSAVGNGQTDVFTVVVASSSDNFEIRSSPIEISITTEAEFSARVRYFDDNGTPLGSGPIPPVISDTTEYRLYWTIENSLHDLENVTVSASLPPHVQWSGVYNTDLGIVTYDPGTRTIEWSINTLPSSITLLEANASLQITPDEDDLGSFVKLISGSEFKATDVVTGALITDTTTSLDTELIGDEFAEGKGVVIEIIE